MPWTLTGNSRGVNDSTLSQAIGALTFGLLDGRYTRKEVAPVAVMIGTSNSVPGETYWPHKVAAKRGWNLKNFSIGGGSLTGNGTASDFTAQLNVALADTSFSKADVKYFVVGDFGNDVRSDYNLTVKAPVLFNTIRTNYPNARIIVLPALWGQMSFNLEAYRIRSVTKRVEELTEAGRPYGVEIVPHVHLWHWDSAEWMLPNEVHYTTAGHNRIAMFMNNYLDGISTDPAIGNTMLPPVFGGTSTMTLRREGGYVWLNGILNVTTAIAANATLFNLPIGCKAFEANETIVCMVDNGGGLYFGAILRTGVFRAYKAMPVGNYRINDSYRIF